MRRKIAAAALGVIALLLGVLIWRLDLPHWKKLDISRLNLPPESALVFDASNQPAGKLNGGENRVWISLESIPGHVQQAFIAAEDQRFYRHHGVDIRRILGALWNDLKTLSYEQGASTITQQLIKLTHLSQDKTLSRKAQEIVLALQLERRMDKPQILEAYLNAVYFGSGAYGIQAAANRFFDKDAENLTLAEGALLAGLIKSPSGYAPARYADRAVARRNYILDLMLENGFITRDACARAQAEPLRLAERDENRQYAWYMDAVLSEAQQILHLSASEIITGGYKLYTGLDIVMQQSAEQMFSDASLFPGNALDGTPAQAALIAMDPRTGEIRAVIGGRNYDVQRGLNRATQMRRQPGSAFKPISTYAAAIDAYGYLPSSSIEDTPRTFAGGYTPGNAGGNSYGTVTLREALSRSLNIATVALADAIGVSSLRTYATRFGIQLAPQDANLSLALGALTKGVSPREICAAYCALGNGGIRVEGHLLRRIEDARGQIIYRAPESTERAVSAETAYMITDMLRSAVAGGSAHALAGCGLPVAAKTGTVTEGDTGTRDIWTVAYTPDVAVAAWMGFDSPDEEHALPASEGGSGYPARLCAAFLKRASDRLSAEPFPRPKTVKTVLLDSIDLQTRHVARLSTELTPADAVAEELFHREDAPQVFSDNWTAPSAVQDLRLLTGPGETPVLAFTAQSDSAEYLILRTVNGETRQAAELRGGAGEELRFADLEHDTAQLAEYAVLPRNALLYERGALLTGPLSPPVRYIPGGLLNDIMNVGAAEAAPTPDHIELEEGQSLFG